MTTTLEVGLEREREFLRAVGRHRVLGFTGTQRGLSPQQIFFVQMFVREFTRQCDLLREAALGRHGCCVGADEQFHRMGTFGNVPMITHPGHIPEKTSTSCSGVFHHLPRNTLERNQLVVSRSWALLVCPSTDVEQVRSGTWATIRYARRVRKPHVQVNLDGTSLVRHADAALSEIMRRM